MVHTRSHLCAGANTTGVVKNLCVGIKSSGQLKLLGKYHLCAGLFAFFLLSCIQFLMELLTNQLGLSDP